MRSALKREGTNTSQSSTLSFKVSDIHWFVLKTEMLKKRDCLTNFSAEDEICVCNCTYMYISSHLYILGVYDKAAQ